MIYIFNTDKINTDYISIFFEVLEEQILIITVRTQIAKKMCGHGGLNSIKIWKDSGCTILIRRHYYLIPTSPDWYNFKCAQTNRNIPVVQLYTPGNLPYIIHIVVYMLCREVRIRV